MSKTLSESAAEILKASMMGAGKEAAQVMAADMQDLGGQTPEQLPTAIGAAASANIKPAAKPGVEGAPAEGMKKAPETAKKIGDEDEALKKNPVDAGSVKAEETEFEGEVVAEEEVEQIDESDKVAKNIAKSIIAGKGKESGLKVSTMNADESGADEQGHQGKVHFVHHKDDEGEGDHIAVSHNKESKKYVVSHTISSSAGHEEPTKHFDNPDDAIAHGRKILGEEVTEITEEEIVEAKKEMMKGMVAKHKGSMKEDVDALFNGESLSEDFRVKATLIFESAVQSRVESIVEEVLTENDRVLAEAVEEIKTELSEQVDEYLNYVVEQWVEENKVAIETGLRAELVNDFISGLKNLFAEHYIEIPEEKVDVAEELALEVASMQETAAEKDAQIASLTEEVNVVKKDKLIRLACEGLTEVQAGKMKSLAESVEFTTEGEFNNKLAIIRENYFPTKTNVTSEVKAIQETAVEEPEVAEVHGIMAHYVKAISKTNAKV